MRIHGVDAKAYFYFALNSGSLISNTWTIGFIASAVLDRTPSFSTLPARRYIKPCGNPLPRVASFRKRKVVPPENPHDLYELQGADSAIKGSRAQDPSHQSDIVINSIL
ncbi:unnamed protein product [Linum trigynum]|uniref:Uncharacterized protein n=1 Tax=Linum trigynum TaxID=586398 RepID=A0AAV2DH04_9ROSI